MVLPGSARTAIPTTRPAWCGHYWPALSPGQCPADVIGGRSRWTVRSLAPACGIGSEGSRGEGCCPWRSPCLCASWWPLRWSRASWRDARRITRYPIHKIGRRGINLRKTAAVFLPCVWLHVSAIK